MNDTLGRAELSAELADRIADVIRTAWDPLRLPWIADNRAPTPTERDLAMRWTTGIWAVEKLRTRRRTESSKQQEEDAAQSMADAGFVEVDRRPIEVLDDLDRGTFCREAQLAGVKCDLPVRLNDGRLLAVECKVSNTAVNSVKRLIRETGGKADAWRRTFGHQVVTAAVLAGVFKSINLLDAQDARRVTIFWQHDLAPLQDFVHAAAP